MLPRRSVTRNGPHLGRNTDIPDDRAAELLNAPVWKAMVTLSGPIVAANLLQTVYQLTDTFWLGRVGPEAVAAVSLSFPVIFLLISLGGGLAVAGGILVAQTFGAGHTRSVDHIATQTLLSVAAISVVLSAVGYFATPAMVGVLGPEPEVAGPAIDYLQISFLGLSFQFLYIVFQSILRSVGDVKTPFVIVLFSVALNFVLDPLFIMGWGSVPAMETAGAAVATILTQGVAALIGLYLLVRGKVAVRLWRADLVPDFRLIWEMVRLGIPASLEQSTRAGAIAMMAVLVTGFGTEVLAAYGIGTRILSFLIIPALGFSMAASTLVGQAVGAGRPERAREVALTSSYFAFVVLLVAGVVLFLLAEPTVRIFLPDAPEVAAEGTRFVRILCLSFAFMGVQQVLAGAFRGAGDTLAAMLLAIFALWVLRFPLAFLLSTRTSLGVDGLWWAFPISEAAAALLAWIWFRNRRWEKNARVVQQQRLERRVVQEAIVEEGLER